MIARTSGARGPRDGRPDSFGRGLPSGPVGGHGRRLKDAATAEAAVAALREEDPLLGGFYDAQLAYTRMLFGIDPRRDDVQRARAGFSAAADDERLAYWATFWLGVLTEHVDHAPEQAIEHYTKALDGALEDKDPMLESYAIRHLGGHALEHGDTTGLDLLRSAARRPRRSPPDRGRSGHTRRLPPTRRRGRTTEGHGSSDSPRATAGLAGQGPMTSH